MTKFTMTREFYAPRNAIKVSDKRSSAVVYVSTDRQGRVSAMGFQGKAAKPAFNHWYRNEAVRESQVRKFFTQVQEREAYRAKLAQDRADKLAQPHKLQIGHILVCSWGWEQTNIDYYQVTALKGARSVELRKIGKVSDEDAWCQGTCTPRADNFTGEAFTKRVDEHNGVKLNSYSWARLWEGKPQRWTAYA